MNTHANVFGLNYLSIKVISLNPRLLKQYEQLYHILLMLGSFVKLCACLNMNLQVSLYDLSYLKKESNHTKTLCLPQTSHYHFNHPF